MFTDPQMVEDIKWLQEAHRGPNQKRWENIVELTEKLFSEVGGTERVKGYHMLEQPCKEVSDEELARAATQHIHEATLKCMTWLVEKCYYK